MIPIDNEFSFLYLIYISTLVLIVYGLVSRPNKREYRAHLLFYICYTGLMMYVFSDKENFSGGGSLVLLFYGLFFPLAHFVI